MNKYLDSNGLLYLWSKIKTLVSSAADAVEWDRIQNKPDLALRSDITAMYKYKGSVANHASLPAGGNQTGDVWNVEETGMNYAWNGTEWDALGQVFDIQGISNAEIDTITAGE